jgi:hypothetical protein
LAQLGGFPLIKLAKKLKASSRSARATVQRSFPLIKLAKKLKETHHRLMHSWPYVFPLIKLAKKLKVGSVLDDLEKNGNSLFPLIKLAKKLKVCGRYPTYWKN